MIGDSQISGVLIQDPAWAGGQHLMWRAYSLDLREGVVAAVTAGERRELPIGSSNL
jgi:hypothetical protein